MNSFPKPIENALVKQFERVYLLNLEKDLVDLIRKVGEGNTKEAHTIKSQVLRNSYYRLLSHQLCQYYNLQHWNNANNEIVVSAIPGFDYQVFTELVGADEFASVASKASNIAQTADNPTVAKPKMIIKKSKERRPDQRAQREQEKQRQDLTENENDKIRQDHASKEALYMKIREEIFEQGEDDEGDDEDEDIIDNNDGDDHNDQINDHNENQERVRSRSHYATSPLPPSGFVAYPYAGAPPMPGPMHMPINYPGPQSHFTQQGPHGHIPPGQHQSHQAYGGNFYAPTVPQEYFGYYPGAYDKETERRLLNNPYIIIPDDKPKRRAKYKRNYKQHNTAPLDNPKSKS